MINLAFAEDLLKKVKDVVNKKTSSDEKKNESAKDEVIVKTNEQEMLSLILQKITDMNNEINSRITQVEARVNDLEMKFENKDEINAIKDNIQKVQTTLGEFGKFYELVCRQYDPFIEEKESEENSTAHTNKKENNKKNKEETNEEEGVIGLIEDARKHIKEKNVKEAQKEYKKIMIFYKSINNQKLKIKIYKEAVKILNDINSIK